MEEGRATSLFQNKLIVLGIVNTMLRMEFLFSRHFCLQDKTKSIDFLKLGCQKSNNKI